MSYSTLTEHSQNIIIIWKKYCSFKQCSPLYKELVSVFKRIVLISLHNFSIRLAEEGNLAILNILGHNIYKNLIEDFLNEIKLCVQSSLWGKFIYKNKILLNLETVKTPLSRNYFIYFLTSYFASIRNLNRLNRNEVIFS